MTVVKKTIKASLGDRNASSPWMNLKAMSSVFFWSLAGISF